MIRKYTEIFCWKNVSSFCTAKATHIFSAKNIRILYIESAKTVNEMILNELVKLTTLWTTGPRSRSDARKRSVDWLAHCPPRANGNCYINTYNGTMRPHYRQIELEGARLTARIWIASDPKTAVCFRKPIKTDFWQFLANQNGCFYVNSWLLLS